MSAALARRRAAVSRHPTRIGLDRVACWGPVDADGQGLALLALHFIPPRGAGVRFRPERLEAHQLRFLDPDGAPVSAFTLGWGGAAPDGLPPEDELGAAVALRLRLPSGWSPGDVQYRIELQDVEGLDPLFSAAPFGFGARRAAAAARPEAPTPWRGTPAPSYMARDYHGLRQLLLDRMATTLPDWTERNPLDLGVTLVEALAHAGDRLSYIQDAVSTEAYLGTARLRSSVRRHARLLGYPLHEGCNARTWVQLEVDAPGTLPAGTQLFTRHHGLPAVIPTGDAHAVAAAQDREHFMTLEPLALSPSLNGARLYSWGATELVLQEGAREATLVGAHPTLRAGQVLILEATRDPQTGAPLQGRGAKAAVRLVEVLRDRDPLGGAFPELLPPGALDPKTGAVTLTRVRWHADDALPFALTAVGVVDGVTRSDLALVRGNVALADHGRPASGLQPSPPRAPSEGRYAPQLPLRHVTYATPYDPAQGAGLSAGATLRQDPRQARPQVRLRGPEGTWTARANLVDSGRFAQEFVVELEEDRSGALRFGDGRCGRRPTPGAAYALDMRVGAGVAGNISAEALGHVITDTPGVKRVRNPLPACGGLPPEPLDAARRSAPVLARERRRAVTPGDFAERARGHAAVQRAAARLRWSGSQEVVVVAVDLIGGAQLTEALQTELLDRLDAWRVAGTTVVLRSARFAPLALKLQVELEDGADPERARSALRAALLDSGGLLHADSLSFGQPIWRSQIEALAATLPGVVQAQVTELRRWNREAEGELDEGVLRVDPLEIPRLQDDPLRPHLGALSIEFGGSE